jgi:hypothetical protein
MSEEIYTTITKEPGQEEIIKLDCSYLWSKSHAFCYKRLSDKTKGATGTYDFVDLYEARAKRIAATYSRFYLELEEGGEEDKIGRYYWMALGAFASKTVACLLSDLRVQASYAAGAAFTVIENTKLNMHEIGNGLGKGNLWLFIDIASSHWLYNNHPEHFSEGMKCEINRDSSALHAAIQKTTDGLPWAAEVLPKLNNLEPSADIIEGFKKIAEFEEEVDEQEKPDLQLESLLAIAEHEQGAVLQPLIYEDPQFSDWCKAQREWWILNLISPDYKIVFARACSTKKAELENHAPKTMKVEGYDSRMSWIEDVAKQFHRLMQKQTVYMQQELQHMGTWRNKSDASIVYTKTTEGGYQFRDTQINIADI